MSHRTFGLDSPPLDMGDLTLLRNGLRVLVVDNDLDSCEVLVALFSQSGIETTIANCVSEAIVKIQQVQPDLLISEISLPYEDGYSLIQQVKILETIYRFRIPAIALTACPETHDRIQALAAGFCRHFSKPIDLDELIAAVADLTEPT